MTAAWRDLDGGAPEIARLGGDRIGSARVALLGTLRADGSPRISPIEPYLATGELLIGVMARSAKAVDLRRDPRCTLQSAVTGPDSGEGELKLHGLAVPASERLRVAASGAWWLAWPAEKADVYGFGIEQAAFVEWDIQGGMMTVHRWTPRGGYHRSSHRYP